MASNGIQYVGGGGATVDGITVVSGGDITLTPPNNVLIASGSLNLNSQGSIINIGAAGNDLSANDYNHINANVGGNVQNLIRNADNTNGASNARLFIDTGGSSGGNPLVLFRVAGGESVGMGLDNTASDNFTIADGSSLGTNDRLRLVITTGVLSVDGDGGGSDDPVSLFDAHDDLELAERFAYSHPAAPEMGVVTRQQWVANRELMVKIGVAEWAEQLEGEPRLMFRLQPMLRMLAGGIYQTQRVLTAQNSKIFELERRLKLMRGTG